MGRNSSSFICCGTLVASVDLLSFPCCARLEMPFLSYFAAFAVVGVTLLFVVVKRKPGKRCLSKTDLSGKTAIVTGANTGLRRGVLLQLLVTVSLV